MAESGEGPGEHAARAEGIIRDIVSGLSTLNAAVDGALESGGNGGVGG